jgi:hypothetical protein
MVTCEAQPWITCKIQEENVEDQYDCILCGPWI